MSCITFQNIQNELDQMTDWDQTLYVNNILLPPRMHICSSVQRRASWQSLYKNKRCISQHYDTVKHFIALNFAISRVNYFLRL